MILTFEHIDPLTGEHPRTLSIYGVHILQRARVLLKKRSREEIGEILNFINWIISSDESRLFAFERLILETRADEIGQEPPEYIGDYHTNTFMINLYKKQHVETPDLISSMEWPEVYSTLAIALLNVAADDEAHYGAWGDKDEWLHEYRIINNASAWIVEATEAISIAETLSSQNQALEISKKALSARNTKANIQRHSKTNVAILEIHKAYTTGQYKSLRNAVQIYCEQNPDKVSHLAPYNQVRTLADGVSEYSKGRRRTLNNQD